MSKKRVSLTLEEELVEKIDAEADMNDVNRSKQVETMINQYLDSRSIKTAVIFCGGEKLLSMNEWEGKPVLAHIMDNLELQDIQRVILLAGDNRSSIEEYFGSRYHSMNLEYISEDEPQGKAAALSKVEERINTTFIALNGHVVSDVDLEDMLEVHREEGSMATMALTTVENPSKYGVARLKGRTILGFEEKPSPGQEPSRLINAGTYILEPEIFDYLGDEKLEDLFAELSSTRELSGYIYGGEWKDFSET